MNIQWYPGHMTKAKRAMKEDLRLIDLIIELVDARAPLASRNPDLDELGKGKSRVILLNKADLAGERENGVWMDWFRAKGFYVTEVNSQRGDGIKKINGIVSEACKEKLERDRRRGILNRPVRAMVVGIPNVGKSTFINSFAGKACTRTGNKPGVTRGNQWIRLNKSLELLDTPGILWPKFEDPKVGLLLAMIGSINDEILDRDELAVELLKFLQEKKPEVLEERYGSAGKEEGGLTEEVLQQIARTRACLKKGGELDLTKAAGILIEDFRSGRLGRITLELPKLESSTEEKLF
ncbi:ribosome biogenesis GTPase YlqF [Candidatus Ventrimonas sp. KK005]|nr:ribosome biogenesis GTPase YlqF [Lachnospiraceae bacterium]NBH16839.1 ribosome biogenesis GTPase YlqF [Clostridiaceae bacterium]